MREIVYNIYCFSRETFFWRTVLYEANYKEREEKAFLGKCSTVIGQLLICESALQEIKHCPFPDSESASCIRFLNKGRPSPRNIAPDLENASCIRFQGERRPSLCVGVWRGPLCCLLLPEPHLSAVICCSVLCSAVHVLLCWCSLHWSE